MKKLLSFVLAWTLCLGLAFPVLAAEEGGPAAFSDVPENHTFYAAVMDCAAKGITGGYDDGTFKPANPVTRAQFCVMLSRAFYPGEVEQYNTDIYKKQGWFVPNTRALFSAEVLTGTSFVSGFATPGTMDQVISRYDMARLMTNIMAKKGFSATDAQKTEAQKKIGDYKSIPSNYQDAVKNVFALGIITGYPDGTFGGAKVMNRGQGCVVIYRMMQYTPATSNPVTPDADSGTPVSPSPKPETPTTPTQPETPAGQTLSNGQPVTEENVLALLDELQKKYPTGTPFAKYSKTVSSIDVDEVVKLNTTTGCGGWAALVSDYIFGPTGFPARKVNFKDARPGDIIIIMNNTGYPTHVGIAISRAIHDTECEFTGIRTTDAAAGSDKAYAIDWNQENTGYGAIEYDDGYLANNHVVYTRYPD